MPDAVRSRAKLLVDTSVMRVVQAATAGVIFLLAAVDLDTPYILAALLFALGSAAAVAAMRLRAPYLDLFRKALGSSERNVDDFELDLNSAELALEALSARDPARVLGAIELLAEQKRSRLIPALILYHEAHEVLVRALAVIATPERTDWIPLAERLLTHEREDVRVAAVFAMVGIGRTEQVEARMSDVSPIVRAHTAFVLVDRDRLGHPLSDPRIEACLEAADAAGQQARRGLLEAIRTRGDRRWSEVVLKIAKEYDETLDEPLARAMEHLRDPAFLPLLVPRLESRTVRGDVRSALVAFGAAGLDAMRSALEDPKLPARTRIHIPRTVAHFGGQAAADLLVHTLANDHNGSVRFRALGALVTVVEDPKVKVERAPIFVELRRNLVEYFRLWTLSTPLADGRSTDAARGLLVALLEDKRGQALSRVFLVLQVLHRSENLRRVHAVLRDGDLRSRANGAEFLDNLTLEYANEGPVGEAACALLRLLADDLPTVERLSRARPLLATELPSWPADADAVLALLLHERDAGIATIAAEYATSSGKLRVEVESASKERGFLGSLAIPEIIHAVG